MVTIKALRNYNDKELNRDIVKGNEYDVGEERANVIIRGGFAELVPTKVDEGSNDGLQYENMEEKKNTDTKKR